MSDQTQGYSPYAAPRAPESQPEPPQAQDRPNVAPESQAPAPARASVAPDEPPEPEDFTHYIHLADGRVIKHVMAEPLGNHYVEGEVAEDGTDNRTQTGIIGVYPR